MLIFSDFPGRIFQWPGIHFGIAGHPSMATGQLARKPTCDWQRCHPTVSS